MLTVFLVLLQPMALNLRNIILVEEVKEVLRQVRPTFDLRCEKVTYKIMHKT